MNDEEILFFIFFGIWTLAVDHWFSSLAWVGWFCIGWFNDMKKADRASPQS